MGQLSMEKDSSYEREVSLTDITGLSVLTLHDDLLHGGFRSGEGRGSESCDSGKGEDSGLHVECKKECVG